MPSTESAEQAVIWQDVACPLCSARQEAPVLELPGAGAQPYCLVRCGQCGLGYMNPRPDEASIGRFYSEDYEDYHRGEDRRRRTPAWLAHLRKLAAQRRCGLPAPSQGWGERMLGAMVAPWLAPERTSLTCLPYHGQGRLLEYGCGSGWLGGRLRRLGWDVTGMDFSAFAAQQAQRLHGLPVIVGSLPHPDVPPESYDVIVMGQVLEHVHWPRAVIAATARALRPGGYLAVAVPNLASWGFRTFRENWWGLQLPIHLLHFTPSSLRRLLETHGLEVRHELQPSQPGWMRRSLAAARRHDAHLPLWLRSLCGFRFGNSLLTRWTVARGIGDGLLMIAHRPVSSEARRAA